MQQPLVSVIVPVYKAEAYLHKCVDSLLAQTMTDFEVLLIDDGSPDRSGAICDEYAAKDSRIRVFHKENGGVASARQVGIENVRGEYTIHADPDDWVEPTMLEELYAKAKKDDADMVICDYYVYTRNNISYNSQSVKDLSASNIIVSLFYGILYGSLCNKLVNTKCFKNYNIIFDKSVSVGEDLLFCLNLLKTSIYKVSYLSKAYYYYDIQVNKNSLVRTVKDTKRIANGQFLYSAMRNMFYGTTFFNLINEGCKYREATDYFIGGGLTSKEFRNKFFPILNNLKFWLPREKFLNFCLFFSCLGFYKLMKFIYDYYLKLRTLGKKIYLKVKGRYV